MRAPCRERMTQEQEALCVRGKVSQTKEHRMLPEFRARMVKLFGEALVASFDYPNANNLNHNAIGVKPVDMDWSEGYGEQWEVLKPIGPDDMEWEDLMDERFPYPDTEYPKIEDFTDDAAGLDAYDAAVEAYDDAREKVDEAREQAAEEWRREYESGDHGPMMNYAYPLPLRGEVDAHAAIDKLNNCCIVRFIDGPHDGEYFLALTGGGMDLTWEICESYIALGFHPPEHFASKLPRMSDRGASERDLRIAAHCFYSCMVAAQWAASGMEEVERVVAWGRERDAKRKACEAASP